MEDKEFPQLFTKLGHRKLDDVKYAAKSIVDKLKDKKVMK